ncbi:MAG TPA: tRNA (adenosine(37)-N6)-dimethylallyltransferase MiaA [Acidobacteriaceae bacterium]|nr:tRNA (adenosine(37)-N6)-dimethylallyltransferase MiaA [Acidobacteriaceae bacterium]
MVMVDGEPLLVVVLGPTASGKTSLSIQLAERFAGEIVSCDSVAVYRGMEIGTAKPSREERARVPHHLINVYEVDEHSTAGDYARRARKAIAEITARGHLPIVTGGTGLYLRALLEGLFPGPQRSEELRERLLRSHGKRGAGWLRRILERLDRVAAERIHANDVPKLIRAIEVSLAAKRPMSEAWKDGREPLTGYRVLQIGLEPERQALYARINARAKQMFDAGLEDETRELLAKYGEGSRALDSLGYRQARAVLRGEMTREAAIAAAQQGHRNYAKRQQTWFRREPEVHWLHGFGEDAGVAAEAEELVEQALGGSSRDNAEPVQEGANKRV